MGERESTPCPVCGVPGERADGRCPYCGNARNSAEARLRRLLQEPSHAGLLPPSLALPPLTRVSRKPLGLSLTVCSGASGELVTRAPFTCRPEWLVVSEETAARFDLRQLQVHADLLLGHGDPLPLETFSVKAYAENPHLLVLSHLDGARTCPAAGRIAVRATNLSGCIAHFRAVLWCLVLEP